jgi:hypothetical protein
MSDQVGSHCSSDIREIKKFKENKKLQKIKKLIFFFKNSIFLKK